ncbi:MAG: hypothetical protein B7Z67_02300 [Acidiphilium sp. 21-60-14]|nr:MAG: hypothetical protein B7Z67_02300 [Acidiphilium sp. 21-60-14]
MKVIKPVQEHAIGVHTAMNWVGAIIIIDRFAGIVAKEIAIHLNANAVAQTVADANLASIIRTELEVTGLAEARWRVTIMLVHHQIGTKTEADIRPGNGWHLRQGKTRQGDDGE